jgi:hypothetical protein
MTTNGNTCESTLLNQIPVKVLFDPLKGTQHFWGYRCNRVGLAEYCKKPIQRCSITQGWVPITDTKLQILLHRPFIELMKIEPFTDEPMTEVTNDMEVAPRALSAMPLLQQLLRKKIDVYAQRTLM